MKRFEGHLSGRVRPYYIIPIAVFLIASACSYFIFSFSLNRTVAGIKTTFEEEGKNLEVFAVSKSDEYIQALYEAKVIFTFTGSASRADFNSRNNSTHLKQAYPGLSMVGFAQKVSLDQASQFILTVRADKSINANGYPDYKISPTKTSGDYLPITYLEPYSKDMMGIDLMSIPTVAAAVEKTRDTGDPAMTGKFRLYADRDGFLTVDSLYRPGADVSSVEARRAAFLGVVFTGFKAYDLFPVLIEKSEIDSRVGIEVFAGQTTDNSSLLYSTLATCNVTCESDYKNPITFIKLPFTASGQKVVPVLDSQWTVRLTASSSYVSAHIGKLLTYSSIIAVLLVIISTFASVFIVVKKFKKQIAADALSAEE